MKCVLLGVVLLAFGLSARAGGLMFSQMENGDVIRVKFVSVGCFHFVNTQLEFTKTDGSIELVAYAAKRKDENEPRLIGRLLVHPALISRLDHMLHGYRKGRKGCSTTVENLNVEFIEKGKTVATESFFDAALSDEDALFSATCSELLGMLDPKRY